MGERTLDHVALQRLSLQEDQTRNELEALRARRAEVMKARINDLESDLAEAEATIAGLREAVAARTDSAHAAADDLLLVGHVTVHPYCVDRVRGAKHGLPVLSPGSRTGQSHAVAS
eukprot:m.72504 g.72504  ORF g.72504 m.72504 type:complete len:116 (+) comp8786_c0_seq3:123-470(+)